MKKEILVDINDYQTRVILLENGDPAEVYIERSGNERLVGNIYKGRVANVLPGMQAAFVDIGLEKNAFLYAGDIVYDKSDFEFKDGEAPKLAGSIRDIVKPGQEIIVQITKEPVGTKGARVSTHVTLPGRTLVLMPLVSYIGVSHRIQSEEERARLKRTLEAENDLGMGAIVRTAAEGKSPDELLKDMRFLARLWESINKRGKYLSAPRLLHAEEQLVFRTIRDLFSPEIDALIINDREFYEKAKVIAGIISPDLEERVKLFEGGDLFDEYGLESRIAKLLSRKVWLKNGGYIVIDQTEALTSIDVNTGKFVGSNDLQQTILETNREAAIEIARQLRLRDISGIVIIDFIDMEIERNKASVLETLRTEFKKDKTKTNVLGITALGLVEMTRKKMRQNISNTLQMRCPYCKGDGRVLSIETVALRIRKQLQKCYEGSNDSFLVEAHPDVIAYIEASINAQAPLIAKAPGKSVYFRAAPALHIEAFSVKAVTDISSLQDVRVF